MDIEQLKIYLEIFTLLVGLFTESPFALLAATGFILLYFAVKRKK